MNTRDKIILNYMPPASIYIPSAALSILKSYLASKGYKVEVKYWNLLLNSVMSAYSTENELFRLVPYLYMMAEEHGDKTALNRILSLLQSIKPEHKVQNDFYLRSLSVMKSNMAQLIRRELSTVDFEQVLIFGISSKFEQWIPGTVLATAVKEKDPGAKVVIGGFGDKDSAQEIMGLFPCYDFAIWGEGEHPLWELCQLIEKGSEEFQQVPRLIYRSDGGIKISSSRKTDFLDFGSYLFPDYDDYFRIQDVQAFRGSVQLPVNTTRGCSWNKCRFCKFNLGYVYRQREVDNVVQEIDHFAKKYSVTKFIFVDNEIVGSDNRKFNSLLDGLIESSGENNIRYHFIGEVIPTGLDSGLIKKMVLAGFRLIHIGYEALTDGLLEKMKKRNNFSDNILMLKFLTKYGDNNFAANIIPGVPDEEEADVRESMNNLHFLRFFLTDDEKIHSMSTYELCQGSPYFNSMPDAVREQWGQNALAYLFPKSLINPEKRFSLFSYSRHFVNDTEWRRFQVANNYYKTNKFNYRIFGSNGVYHYQEYFNGKSISEILFDKPEYWDILRVANDQVMTFEKMHQELKIKYPNLEPDKLRGILKDLKQVHLLYCNHKYSNIISIVDTTIVL